MAQDSETTAPAPEGNVIRTAPITSGKDGAVRKTSSKKKTQRTAASNNASGLGKEYARPVNSAEIKRKRAEQKSQGNNPK